MQAMSVNIYADIVALFQRIGDGVISQIMASIASVLTGKVMAALYVVIILIWLIKKLQEGDLFQWGNISKMLVFMGFWGFFFWATHNVVGGSGGNYSFKGVFQTLTQAPANYISSAVRSATSDLYKESRQAESKGFNTRSSNEAGLAWLIQKSLTTAQQVWEKTKFEIGLIGGNIYPSILLFIFILIYYIATIVFVTVVMIITVMTGVQLTIWYCLAPIALAMLYFSQTRAITGQYIKTIMGLTVYQPLLLIVASFNFAISNHMLSSLNEYLNKKPSGGFLSAVGNNLGAGQVEQIGYVTIGIIGVLICIYLVMQIPNFIQGVIGAGGGVGAGVAAMGGAAIGAAGGAMLGGAAAAGGGMSKSLYQNAGGGLGGLAQAGLGIATGGISAGLSKAGNSKAVGNIASKGGIGGQIAKGAQSAANFGMKINDKMNQTNMGSNINDGINKLTGSSAVIKNIADKASGKAPAKK